MTMQPGDYVRLRDRDIADPYVTVAISDMYGVVTHVTIPRAHTANGHDIDTLRAAANRKRVPFRRTGGSNNG